MYVIANLAHFLGSAHTRWATRRPERSIPSSRRLVMSSWGTARADPISLNIAGTGKYVCPWPNCPPVWNIPKHSWERERESSAWPSLKTCCCLLSHFWAPWSSICKILHKLRRTEIGPALWFVLIVHRALKRQLLGKKSYQILLIRSAILVSVV